MFLLKRFLRIQHLKIIFVVLLVLSIAAYFHFTTIEENSCVECQNLLKFLYEKNIFLTDYDLLKEISILNNSTYFKLNLNEIFHKDSILSFGVFQEDFHELKV
jgi:hypothetical protein